MLEAEQQWIALYTKPRAEKRVEENLRRLGYDCYLPLRRELHQWSDRRQWVEVPLLTSYVFVRVAVSQLAMVQSVQGVAFVVRFNGAIAIVRNEEIDALRLLIKAEKDMYVRGLDSLRCGRQVRVNSGRMEGLRGVLVSDNVEGNFAVRIEGISMGLVMHIEGSLLDVID